MYRVVYITSAMHSGSTLLDFMLGVHSAVCSLGEIQHLEAYASLRHHDRVQELSNKCACGAPDVNACEFWREVDRQLQDEFGLRLAELRLRSEDDEEFGRHNLALFDAVAATSGATILVDSSKGLPRLRRLNKLMSDRLTVVCISRQPHGQVYSVLKRHPGIGVLHPCMKYNRFAFRVNSLLRRRDHFRLTYEDLVTRPADSLKTLMNFLGLEFEDHQLQFRSGEHHNLGGNRMRLSGESVIRLDNAWERELNWRQRLLISLSTAPSALIR